MKKKTYLKKGYLLKVPGKRKQVRVAPQRVKMPKKHKKHREDRD